MSGQSRKTSSQLRKTSAESRGEIPDGMSQRKEGRSSSWERIPEAVARRIRLVVLDVDGVLTDAGVFLGETGSGEPVEMKRFDIQDGLGIHLMRNAGLKVALLSGRPSPATRIRAEELGLDECIQEKGGMKIPALKALLVRTGVEWDEVAMLGDDLPDLPVLRRVGLPAAVGNAVPEVRRAVAFTTRREGGHGAVREFARILLEARGEWDRLVEAYCAARDDD